VIPEAVLIWASFAVLVGASFVGVFRLGDRRLERRIYWAGWCVGAAGIAVAAYQRQGWRDALLAFVWIIVSGIGIAIRFTPYLKIGGRIIASSRFDRRPDPTGNDDTGSPPRRRPLYLSADDVRSVSFSKAFGRLGYDPGQVDALLERIAARLDGDGEISAEDIRTAKFSRPRPFVRGYDPDQVDQLLGDAITTLAGADTAEQVRIRGKNDVE
jgi:DivIVA domain-containing protein